MSGYDACSTNPFRMAVWRMENSHVDVKAVLSESVFLYEP